MGVEEFCATMCSAPFGEQPCGSNFAVYKDEGAVSMRHEIPERPTSQSS